MSLYNISNIVMVKNMVVGEKYIVNGEVKTLKGKETSDDKEYKLTFEEESPITKPGDDFYKKNIGGGRRKYRRNRTNKKSRKTNHRRR